MSESQFQDIGSSFIRVSSVENQFYEYKEQILNLNLQITGLVQSKNQMVKQLKRYVQIINEKENTIQSLSSSVFQLAGRICALDEDNQKLKEQVESCENKYKGLLEQRVMQRDKERMELSQQWDQEIKKYEEIIDQLEVKFIKSQQQVSILKKTLTEKNQKISQQQSKTSGLLQQIEQLNQEITSFKFEFSEKRSRKAQNQLIESTIDELQNLLHHVNHSAQIDYKASPVSQAEQLSTRIRHYEDEKKELQEKVHYLELQILDRRKKYDDLERTVVQLKQQKQQPLPKQEQKASNKLELQKLYNEVLDQQRKYELQIKRLSKKQQEYQGQVSKNCELLKEIADMNHKIESLNDWNTKHKDKIVALTEENLNLKEIVQSTETQLETLMRETRNMQQCQYQLQNLKQKQIQLQDNRKQKQAKLKKQPSILELVEIQRTLKIYIVWIIQEIEGLKLEEQQEKFVIKDELKKVQTMFKETLRSYTNFFDNPKEQVKIRGCSFSS